MNTTITLGMGLFGFGPGTLLIFLILGLLIFGSRLPSVGKNLGRSIIEFKKGIKGVQDEIEDLSTSDAPPAKASTANSDVERERRFAERERQLVERERALSAASLPEGDPMPEMTDDRRVSRSDTPAAGY